MNLPRPDPRRNWIVSSVLLALGTAGCGETDSFRSESLDGGDPRDEIAARDTPRNGSRGEVTHELLLEIPEDHGGRRQWLRDRLKKQLKDDYDIPLPKATEEDLRKGAEIWSLLCLGCHGEGGRGRRALSQMLPVQPGDLTDPARHAFFSEQAKLHIVAEGSPGTPMFGWKEILTEENMRAVVAHLATLVRSELVTPEREKSKAAPVEPKEGDR
ncbi:MAG TPA: cytochrome c [Pirellulaceae bacterium]|jgi:mono/diheme cytochrome c family protein|nr:cytochrome c [Pirellulaceae bacterium]